MRDIFRDRIEAGQRQGQRSADRAFESKFTYPLQNIDLRRSVDLIVALWDHSDMGGILPARVLHLMLDCGLLLLQATPNNIEGAWYDLRVGDEIFYGGRPHWLSEAELHMLEPYD
jgi:hypothetical protein